MELSEVRWLRADFCKIISLSAPIRGKTKGIRSKKPSGQRKDLVVSKEVRNFGLGLLPQKITA